MECTEEQCYGSKNIYWLIENLLFQHGIVYLLKQREFHRFRSFGLTIQSVFYLHLLRNKNNEIDPLYYDEIVEGIDYSC